MTVRRDAVLAVITLCLSALALAQPAEPLHPPLVNWTAPPYWTPLAGQHLDGHVAYSVRGSGEGRDPSVATVDSAFGCTAAITLVTLCRLVDTRHGPIDLKEPGGVTPAGFPRGQYASGETRSYALPTSSACSNLPTCGVGGWLLQFQFTTQGGSGQPSYLVAWPYNSAGGIGGQTAPVNGSIMLGYSDRWTANFAIIPGGNDNDSSINVYVQNAGDVIIEVIGYSFCGC